MGSTVIGTIQRKAKKTSTAEVAAVLEGLDWEEEYTIPGKNTHVCPKICFKKIYL